MLNERDYKTLINLLPFREFIPASIAESLRTHSTIKEWYAGEKISDLGRTGIGMIAFLSGRARVSLVSASAHQVTISVSRREDIIYVGGNPSPQVLNNYELEAEVDVRAIIVPLSDFEAMLHADARIENAVLRSVLGLFNAILFDMQNFLFQDLSQRLAAHLLFEYSQQGTASVVTTHQRIANSIASSREVVSRMLKQWEHSGIVELSRGRVRLCEIEELTMLANE